MCSSHHSTRKDISSTTTKVMREGWEGKGVKESIMIDRIKSFMSNFLCFLSWFRFFHLFSFRSIPKRRKSIQHSHHANPSEVNALLSSNWAWCFLRHLQSFCSKLKFKFILNILRSLNCLFAFHLRLNANYKSLSGRWIKNIIIVLHRLNKIKMNNYGTHRSSPPADVLLSNFTLKDFEARPNFVTFFFSFQFLSKYLPRNVMFYQLLIIVVVVVIVVGCVEGNQP